MGLELTQKIRNWNGTYSEDFEIKFDLISKLKSFQKKQSFYLYMIKYHQTFSTHTHPPHKTPTHHTHPHTHTHTSGKTRTHESKSIMTKRLKGR